VLNKIEVVGAGFVPGANPNGYVSGDPKLGL
jgi:hypothetical protein